MPFVIHDLSNRIYLALHKNVISWEENIINAHKFSLEKKAQNFINHQLKDSGYDISTCSVVDFSPQILNESVGLTAEEADAYINQLPQMVATFYDASQIICALLDYYNSIYSETDLETNDLLHKIEFSNLNAAEGYRMYKHLQDVRLRRRIAKDNISMLGLFAESGLTKSLANLRKRMDTLLHNVDHRTYHPRILQEIFDTVS